MAPTPTNPSPAPSPSRLWAEHLTLFYALPACVALGLVRAPIVLLLASALVTALWMLARDPTFDRSRLWSFGRGTSQIPGILALGALAAVALSWLTLVGHPERFLDFPRENPLAFALVLVLYPIVSVYPQSVVYRALLMHRYRPIFGEDWGATWASAAAFCFAHVIFHNPVALGLTAVGGILFARTYQKHGSLLASWFEHALYGCVVFAVGLGWSIYAGAPRP